MHTGILDQLGIFRSTEIKNSLNDHHLHEVIHHAIRQVASIYKVPYQNILGKCRKREFVQPRQMVFFLLRYKYKCGPKKLSHYLSKNFNFNIDHSTINYAANTVFDCIETNLETYECYKKLHFLSAIFYTKLVSHKELKLLPQNGCITTRDLVKLGRKKLEYTDKINELLKSKKRYELYIFSIEGEINDFEHELRILSDYPIAVLAAERISLKERKFCNGS